MQRLAWWKEKALREEASSKRAGLEAGLEQGREKERKNTKTFDYFSLPTSPNMP